MIKSNKISNAVYSLNTVLVLARHMAISGEAGAKVAEVLDTAEYLTRLMADEEDKTDDFRNHLQDLANKHASFTLAVDRFDRRVPKSW